MEHDLSNLVGICGLYCGTCPSYLAYRKNDMEYIEKRSQEKGCSLDELRCDGCLSDKVAAHCKDCRHGFRSCAAEKQVNWCFECDKFPCQRLEDFTGIHVVNGISHHEHVIDNLQYMKKHGIEEWVKTQDKADRCSGCGEALYWFDHKCPDCKGQVLLENDEGKQYFYPVVTSIDHELSMLTGIMDAFIIGLFSNQNKNN